jgi:iron complex outermembrane receptor protein
LAGFYNQYDDVRSINLNPAPPPGLTFANGQQAETWGIEISGNIEVTNWWRLRGGYTYLGKEFRSTSRGVVSGSDTFEAIDPHNQFLFQSMLDLPRHFQFDAVGHFVDSLPATAITRRVPAYFGLDLRLAWHYQNWELSVVSQNLAQDRHVEFGSIKIPRSVYGKVAWRF